jgi:hypothetical protein
MAPMTRRHPRLFHRQNTKFVSVTLPMISDDERRGRLAVRHLLLPEKRAADVPAVAEALVALHSSDPVTVYLTAAARLGHPSVEAVDTALHRDGRCSVTMRCGGRCGS